MVLVTHDCDIANDREPHVEIIVGKRVASADGNFTAAKNPRTLHLPYNTPDDREVVIELEQAQKRTIPKTDFCRCQRDTDLILSDDNKRILKEWLAIRYGRPAFPNAFENRLDKLKNKIAKILGKPSISQHLIGVFFDLGEDRGKELEEGEDYCLRIILVYDAQEGGPEARRSAEDAAEKIRQAFHNHSPNGIILDQCEALADTEFTLADIRKVDRWRLEYLSLREDPPGPHLSTASHP